MDWRKRIGTVLGFGPPLVILAVSAAARGRYRKGAGAFFFENGWLALNTGLPYPVPWRGLNGWSCGTAPGSWGTSRPRA
ncbi:MAG: hypothetical protein HFF98_05205 [Oscillibacter sp.]|jgi:hypothetical protein|nr:hypothetical protein [Oscillibacter sp.]